MISAWQEGNRLPTQPPLSIRIGSFMTAYGLHYPFARFWKLDSGAVSCIDGAATVIAQEVTEEIREFLNAIGANHVASTVPLLDSQCAYPVWKKATNGFHDSPVSVNYRRVYDILGTSFALPAWDIWYVDVCHRVRHGCAVALSDEHAALCAAQYGHSLFLTGICTSPDYRREGEASRLLDRAASLCCEMYAVTQTKEAEDFYAANGFEQVGVVYLTDERKPL